MKIIYGFLSLPAEVNFVLPKRRETNVRSMISNSERIYKRRNNDAKSFVIFYVKAYPFRKNVTWLQGYSSTLTEHGPRRAPRQRKMLMVGRLKSSNQEVYVSNSRLLK
ncbi:hypothetical protein P8452_71598 [Trifolium repens]|nr:hypothetical protein P8452_71598 [Trifolium repens]